MNDETNKVLEEEKDVTVTNSSELMEQIVENEEVVEKDSTLTQTKYFFTSWTKYFESVLKGGKPLMLIAIVIGITLMASFFLEGTKEATMEMTRVQLEELYSADRFDGMDTDAFIEQAVQGGAKQFQPINYILISSISILFGLLFNTVFLFILALIFKAKEGKKFSKVLTVAIGALVISNIFGFISVVAINYTGSLVNITSALALSPNTSIQSVAGVILSYISASTIILAIYYYFMGKELFKLSKGKSIVYSVVIFLVPLLLQVGLVFVNNVIMASMK